MAKRPAATAKVSFSTVRISEIADLLRLPPGVKNEQIKKGGKRVRSISITDIPEAGYIVGVESLITLSAEKFKSLKKYVIQPFDVVMSIQGTVGTVGIVPEKFTGNWMANISLLVIRFREKKQENAIALCMYLKSGYGREIIKKLQKGDAIKRINVKEFAAVQIPELTADVRKAATSAFKEEINVKARIEDLYDSMQAVRAAYLA
jgi:restriction endonuclease S subunit